MPPKVKDSVKNGKKGKIKSGKEKVSAVIIDGMPVCDMTKDQLEGHIIRLKDELDREREERNFFQLERDKMQTFWEVTKQKLEETKTELRNRDRDLEEAEERHLDEIQVYKQKAKHMMYEHQCKLTEVKTEGLATLKQAEDKYKANENDLNEEKRALKKQMRDRETKHHDTVQTLKLKNSEEQNRHLIEFHKQMSELESKCEVKLKALSNEMESHRKKGLTELEERKKQQIQILTENHEKAFVDIKNYYNDITVNNLALISTLKEQINSMKKKEDRIEKRMNDVLAENKQLKEPLQTAQSELSELKKQMVKKEREKVMLNNSKRRLKAATEEIKNLKWEQEVIEQKFKQLQAERDDLHNKFVSAIQEVQQKSSLKNVLLEHKLQTLEEIAEQKDAQLHDVLMSCNIDPYVVTSSSKKLETVLHSKDSTIRNMQLEIANLKKSLGIQKTSTDSIGAAVANELDSRLKLPQLALS